MGAHDARPFKADSSFFAWVVPRPFMRRECAMSQASINADALIFPIPGSDSKIVTTRIPETMASLSATESTSANETFDSFN